MSKVERICLKNGQDALFYPYGIYGEQDGLVSCSHKPNKKPEKVDKSVHNIKRLERASEIFEDGVIPF